jgi:hypothetical protein
MLAILVFWFAWSFCSTGVQRSGLANDLTMLLLLLDREGNCSRGIA